MILNPQQASMQNNRRLKKREADRKSQRSARERTRKRIAELEATVEMLRRSECGTQLSTILDQLSKVTKEKDELLQAFKSMSEIIQRHLEPVIPARSLRNTSEGAESRDKNKIDDLEPNGSTISGGLSPLTDTPASSVASRNDVSDNFHQVDTWFWNNQPADSQTNGFLIPSTINTAGDLQLRYFPNHIITDTQHRQHEPFNNFLGYPSCNPPSLHASF
jgi:hypothetical protein